MTSVALLPARQSGSDQPKVVRYKQATGLSLLLLVATLALYFPVIHHPFADIDDQGYVYENLHVQDGLTWSTFKWGIRTFDDNNWHPLTWFSHALDCQMFGLDPMGHHAVNMLWHAADAVALFWVLLFATGFVGRSFMVAALFAVHPINVEAVAWMAERKTLLSTFFFIVALGAYRWYARQPGKTRYCIVAALFILGLMAKPQIITLPCVLLLWDYWPLQRMFPQPATSNHGVPPLPQRSFYTLVKEKIPLFGICALSALVTAKAQHVGHPAVWPYSIWIRLGNAVVAYVRYLGKALWPTNLAVMYLHPGYNLRIWHVAASAVLLIAITWLVLRFRHCRYLPVGWFWFLGTMVPTIGLMQVGRQAMADRYAYDSFLGLFVIACWGVADWAQSAHLPKAAIPVLSVVVLVSLAAVTYRQIGYWKDDMSLWTHTLQATGDNWMAHDMIAGILLNSGHPKEALVHYRAVIVENPGDPAANLALALDDQAHGRPAEAIQFYRNVLRGVGDPLEQAKAYHNMGLAYGSLGQADKAAACFRRSDELRRTAEKLQTRTLEPELR